MNENHITIVGNVVNEPEVRVTANGIPFAAFRVASSSRRFNPTTRAWENGNTNFFHVTAFRGMAANVKESLFKGAPVIVTGRLRVNQFTRSDNSVGTSVEIDAHTVGHDLSMGQATFTRATRALQVDTNDRMADPEVQAAHGGEDFRTVVSYPGYVDVSTGEVLEQPDRDPAGDAVGTSVGDTEADAARVGAELTDQRAGVGVSA